MAEIIDLFEALKRSLEEAKVTEEQRQLDKNQAESFDNPKPYVVQWGPVGDSEGFATFAEALEEYRRRNGRGARIYNSDLCDHDWDAERGHYMCSNGLTDEEREQL